MPFSTKNKILPPHALIIFEPLKQELASFSEFANAKQLSESSLLTYINVSIYLLINHILNKYTNAALMRIELRYAE
jgi:hypothetical protein